MPPFSVKHPAPVHLILFSRAPVSGETKTRLAAGVGAEAAKRFHVCCLQDLLEICARFCHEHSAGGSLYLYITPPDSTPSFEQEGISWPPGVRIRPQRGAHLGERMNHAFTEVLGAQSSARALLLGCDLPLLHLEHLEHAAVLLEEADVVFGGTEDGGYYLVGLNRPRPELFAAQRWGSEEVLARSLALAQAKGLRTATVETLPDVDVWEDLARLRRHPRFAAAAQRRGVRFLNEL